MTTPLDRSRLVGRTCALLMSCLVLTSACGSEDHEPAPTAEVPVWRVGAERTFVAGTSPHPDAALHLVLDAATRSDGTVVVANGGLESRLPIFGPDGSYLRSIGRLGDGPGEFRWVSHLERVDSDSITIFDASLSRITTVAPDGGAKVVAVRAAGAGGAGDIRRFRSVLRLAGGWAALEMDYPMPGEVGDIIRDTIAVGVLRQGLSVFDAVAELPALMSTTFDLGGRPAFGTPAFSPLVVRGTWGRCLFVGTGETAEIMVYSSTGERVGSFTGPGSPRRATGADFDAWIEHRLESADVDEREMLRSSFRDMAWVESLPFYRQLFVDPWGRIWLQEFAVPAGAGRRWYLVDQSGHPVAEVETPEPVRVFEISDEGILGQTVNEFGEEFVVRFPLGDVPAGGAGGEIEACVP